MGSSAQAIRLSLALMLGLVWGLAAQAAETCREDRVELRGDWGRASFRVEVADDRAERARGLMMRESLARSAGMLFVYDRPRRVSFWMKNTLIPLDMIFADGAGRVVRVHSMAEPLSERPIFGGDNIRFVLEINGGMAELLGIGPGTEIRHPAIPAGQAAWPC